MGAVLLGLGICGLVTAAWGVVTVIEERWRARGRGKQSKWQTANGRAPRAGRQWQAGRLEWPPRSGGEEEIAPWTKPNPTAEDFELVTAFLQSAQRVECAWCRQVLQPGVEPVSHGICPQCAREHFGVTLGKEARS